MDYHRCPSSTEISSRGGDGGNRDGPRGGPCGGPIGGPPGGPIGGVRDGPQGGPIGGPRWLDVLGAAQWKFTLGVTEGDYRKPLKKVCGKKWQNQMTKSADDKIIESASRRIKVSKPRWITMAESACKWKKVEI